MHPRSGPGRKKGPAAGALLTRSTSEWGASDAHAREGHSRSQAEEKQERGGDTVENPFELRERHDTHLSVGNPQLTEGVFYLNSAQIGASLAAVKASLRRLDMNLW